MAKQNIYSAVFSHDPYNVTIVTDRDIERFKEDGVRVIEKESVNECQTCGFKTKKLSVVDTLARCRECVDVYYDTMIKADHYRSLAWDPYENNYDY